MDAVYAQVVAAGFEGDKEPWDAFWGQRYAQLRDPDGVPVDLYAPSSVAAPVMLFSPEAHEPLAGEPWSAERAQAAIARVVEDAESAFDDGWPAHPLDLLEHEDPATRFRALYLGGAGVAEALHRLARRGFVELRRDYVPYLVRLARSSRRLSGRGCRA